eukprot:TRINITY_DN5644_c0_g1_i4.p1 TRINITY_DN5644_c0_g1~~TRINITY_DN5644_c0_g1_i4.p1  ORF type:complete len:1741 (+),score=268.72 TRINITY_DN5644_c0_g1_i4:45-5225(+)
MVAPPARDTAVSHPTKLDFGPCPVKIRTSHGFTIKNLLNVPVAYNWEVPLGDGKTPAPFTVVPSKGKLGPKEEAQLALTFNPVEASVFVAAAVCRTSASDKTTVFKVSGIGKYPYIRASHSMLEFGEVYVGKKVDRKITLKNASLVPAAFKITPKDKNTTSATDPFSFKPSAAVIKPESELVVTVNYSPTSCGLYTLNGYTISTVGGANLSLTTAGLGIGPSLSLSSKHLHFGERDLRSTAKLPFNGEKVITIRNKSPHECTYQIVGIEKGCAFRVVPSFGSIQPQRSANLTFTFFPSSAMNYYKRVYLLTLGSTEPLWIDLMGTAFEDGIVPPTFNVNHVSQMVARSQVGLANMIPKDINDMLVAIRSDTAPKDDAERVAREALLATIEPPPCTEKAALLDIFDRCDVNKNSGPFCLSNYFLDFGTITARSETRVISISNSSPAKATARWEFPADSLVVVEPEVQDIPSCGTVQFNVTAHSKNGPSSYQNTLECYICYSSTNSRKRTRPDIVIPSVCKQLQCVVHGAGEQYPVQASLSSNVVDFPPIHVGDKVFQTIAIRNTEDTSCYFEVDPGEEISKAQQDEKAARDARTAADIIYPAADSPDDLPPDVPLASERAFSIYPTQGVIPAGKSQILLLQFYAPSATIYKSIAQISFHNSRKTLPLSLQGCAYTPAINLRNDGTIYFKSTFTNMTTSRAYTIENPCRIDLAYRWEVPTRYQNIVTIEPSDGILRGNEKKNIRVHFRPDKVKKYIFKIPVICGSAGIAGDEVQQQLTVIGEGITGALSVEPQDMELETIVAGDEVKKEFTLFNSTSADASYALGWVASDGCAIEESEVCLTAATGIVPLRAHKTVHLVFRPRRRGTYSFRIFCRTLFDTSPSASAWASSSCTKPPDESELAKLPGCFVSAQGGYPVLEITDIKCSTICKAHLWNQVSVDRINSCLAADVDADDVDKREYEFKKICDKHEHIPVVFGGAVVGTQTTKVFITAQNTSEIVVDYSFRLPSESDIPQERWYHEDLPSAADYEEELVLDNNLFSIEPSKGRIFPGDSATIQLLCRRSNVGHHKLGVLFQIKGGKRIVLNFSGRTLSAEEKHLDILQQEHVFSPVAIGERHAPMQFYELRNSSHVPVSYELAADPFVAICDACYDFPVFQCLNSYGDIPPLSSVQLQWYFRPLEAREYNITVPIVVQGGPTYEVKFIGNGFHPCEVDATDIPNVNSNIRQYPTQAEDPTFPVVVTQDVFTLGVIPVHSLHRRIVILKNSHTTDTFSFDWRTTFHSSELIVEVEPATGTISAGESVCCRLTLYSGPLRQIIDQSVQCKVINQCLQDRRNKLRQIAEQEMAMALEPTSDDLSSHQSPTGKVMSATGSAHTILGRGRRGHQVRVPVTQPGKHKTQAQLQQTVTELMNETYLDSTLDDNSPEATWVDVSPQVIDVRLQAQVISIETYRDSEPDECLTQFHPTLAVYEEHIESPLPDPPTTIKDLHINELQPSYHDPTPRNPLPIEGEPPTEGEVDLVMNYLSDLILETIHDSDIEDAFNSLDDCPARLYAEFAAGGNELNSDSQVRAKFKIGEEVVILETEELGIVTGHARGRIGVTKSDGSTAGFLPFQIAGKEYTEQRLQLRRQEKDDSDKRRLLQSGEFQEMLESYFESLVFDIIQDSILNHNDENCSLIPPRVTRLRLAQDVAAANAPQPSADFPAAAGATQLIPRPPLAASPRKGSKQSATI